jgi:hypothetical protein
MVQHEWRLDLDGAGELGSSSSQTTYSVSITGATESNVQVLVCTYSRLEHVCADGDDLRLFGRWERRKK